MLQRTRVATKGCKLSNFARRSLAWTVLIPFVAATLAGCSGGVLQPQGPIASANAIILLDAVGIMAVIVVPTIAAVLGCAWWYRASNTRARYLPHFVYSGRLELLVWAIPLLVIDQPPLKWSDLRYVFWHSRRTDMPRRRYKPEEIVAKLRQVDVLVSQGSAMADAIRQIGVSEVTYYRWRREFGGLKSDQVKRLKDLELENSRLRKAVSDLTLDKLILTEAARGNY
jgi:transposase-like protein